MVCINKCFVLEISWLIATTVINFSDCAKGAEHIKIKSEKNKTKFVDFKTIANKTSSSIMEQNVQRTATILKSRPCLLLKDLAHDFNANGYLVISTRAYINESMICAQKDDTKFQSTAIIENDISLTSLNSKLLLWKGSKIRVFFVVCPPELTSHILQQALRFEMTDVNHYWFVINSLSVIGNIRSPRNTYVIENVQNGSFSVFEYTPIWLKYVGNCTPQGKCNIRHQQQKIVRPILRICTIIEPPFTFIHPAESVVFTPEPYCATGRLCWQYSKNGTEHAHCCIGYMMNMLDSIERDLNIVAHVYMVRDTTYGDIVDGRWVGMVGDLVYNRADMVFAALTVNKKRAEVVHFAPSYLLGGAALAVIKRKQEVSFINFKMFEPIDFDIWLLIVITVVVVSGIMCVTEKWRYYYTGRKRKYPFTESLVYVVGRMFERGMGVTEPRTYSSRAVITTTSLAMMCIMSMYTAVLTANGILYTDKLPITGFKDKRIINPTKRFKFGTIQNSSFTQMFKRSPDPNLQNMYLFMKPYNFVDTKVAVEKLKRGELGAVIQDQAILYYYIAREKDCSIQLAGKPIGDAGFAIAVQKNSSLKVQVDKLMLEYHSEGFFNELKNDWLSSKCIDTSETKNGEAVQIGLTLFGGMYIVCFIGLMVVLVIFVTEVVAGNMCNVYKINK